MLSCWVWVTGTGPSHLLEQIAETLSGGNPGPRMFHEIPLVYYALPQIPTDSGCFGIDFLRGLGEFLNLAHSFFSGPSRFSSLESQQGWRSAVCGIATRGDSSSVVVVTDASVPQPGWYGPYQKPDLDFGHHVFHDKTQNYTFADRPELFHPQCPQHVAFCVRQVPVPRVLSPSPDPGAPKVGPVRTAGSPDLTPRPRPRLEMLEEPLEVLAAVAQASAWESGEGNFRNEIVHQIHVDIDILYVS